MVREIQRGDTIIGLPMDTIRVFHFLRLNYFILWLQLFYEPCTIVPAFT